MAARERTRGRRSDKVAETRHGDGDDGGDGDGCGAGGVGGCGGGGGDDAKPSGSETAYSHSFSNGFFSIKYRKNLR